MNTTVSSGKLLRGVLDSALLLALAGALWGVSVYDWKASQTNPGEAIQQIDNAEAAPEPPPPEPPPEEPPEEKPPKDEPPPEEPPEEPAPEPPPTLPEITPIKVPTDPVPRISVQFAPWDLGRFGMNTTTGNPDDPDDNYLNMIFDQHGRTNNTRVWVDGETPDYGSRVGATLLADRYNNDDAVYESAWKYRNVSFTQTVKLVPGDVSRRMDSVQVVLQAKNEGSAIRQVGARYMVDTLIGGNDGVPFIVAGRHNLIQKATVFRGQSVPDFIRALQYSSLSNPGVIVDIGLRCPGAERPDEVTLTHWPGNYALWNYNRTSALGQDSAAGMYFKAKALPSGESRTMGYTYGLGSISSTGSQNARLSLTAGGPFTPGGSFWLVALVQSPKEGGSVEVTLPKGMALGPAEQAKKSVAADGALSQISWLVAIGAETAGSQDVSVKLLPEDVVEKQILVVDAPAIKLSMKAPEKATAGKLFWVSAMVRNPKNGQTIELKIPDGLTFEKGHAASQAVAQGKSQHQVNWMLRSNLQTSGDQRLRVQLHPDETATEATTKIELVPSTLTLKVPASSSAGKAFWVSAVVRHPKPGQSVELVLPEGLAFAKGHVSRQAISADKSYHQANWLLKSASRANGDHKLQCRLGPGAVTAEGTVKVLPGTIID